MLSLFDLGRPYPGRRPSPVHHGACSDTALITSHKHHPPTQCCFPAGRPQSGARPVPRGTRGNGSGGGGGAISRVAPVFPEVMFVGVTAPGRGQYCRPACHHFRAPPAGPVLGRRSMETWGAEHRAQKAPEGTAAGAGAGVVYYSRPRRMH